MSRPLRRPGRTPGSVNLGIAIAVLAILLPLLLNAATAAPPTAAEFSPNAQQVIKQAPPGQGAAVNGSREPTPTPTATPKATPTPTKSASAAAGPPENLVKRCVGPPPLRQIEDPQSPPCIAFWKGDNGGATSRGVTGSSIYIAIPTPENAKGPYGALEKFFNKRFQFYNRQLVFEYCSSSGGGSGSSDETNQRADAAKAAAGCEGKPPPFASTFYRQNNGAYYMPAMACRYKTIVVGSYSPYDKAFLDRCPGYQYQYPMVVDEQLANLGEWSCNRLAGRTARWAEGTDGSTPGKQLTSLARKFGVVLEPFTKDDPVARPAVLAPLLSRLRACGAAVADEDVLINPVGPDSNFDAASAQTAMLHLKQDGVTSVICLCNFFSLGTAQRAAETNSYRPEWVSSTFGLSDVNSSFVLAAGPGSQMRHTFGLTFQPRMVSPLLNPYNTAIQEGDPSVATDTTTTGEAFLEIYRALLLISSGIQMAGPNLNPQTFRDGLRNAAFPNPDTPLKAGAVDVRPDGYSMTADGAEWWYSTSANGPFTDSSARAGTVCYVDRGVRHKLGSWPKGEAPFFNGKCYSGG